MSTIEITEHDRVYWKYEYDVVAHYLVPLLKQWGVDVGGTRLLDIGCGDGGGLSAFHDAGMVCKGFDIEERRVELAEALADKRSMDLTQGNLYETPPPFSGETFDLLVLHDVFEHLRQKSDALKIFPAYLKRNGRILITFPPYYSAFGAHQQLLRSPLGKIPFIHLVPFAMAKVIPNLRNEHKPFVEEIGALGRMKMGIAVFERLARESGLTVEHRKFYIISPNHVRFGLRPMEARFLGTIPFIRELLVTGVAFLLKTADQ